MNDHPLRAELPLLPPRIRSLPLDHRGFPIPWFVQTQPDGTKDFRFADYTKRNIAVKKKLCWVCGGHLGKFMSFTIGPMCAVTRTTSEPPCHRECAIFAATACPFLSRPRMRRNDKGIEEIDVVNPPGLMITRNPGTVAVWTTKNYTQFSAGKGEWLIQIGDPEEVLWYAEGREAKRDEVKASIDSGYPFLLKEAEKRGRTEILALAKYMIRVEKLLPAI